MEDWYGTDEADADLEKFADRVESAILERYPDAEYFSEPSVQGTQGGDFTTVTLGDGSSYDFEFDWNDELEAIFELGPTEAAAQYASEILEGIG